MTAEETLLCILNARDPRNRGDELVFVLPRIGTVVGPQDVAADDFEVLPKLVLHLALPLERETGWGDDQGAFDEAANL